MKRILSFILVLSLLAGILPATVAETPSAVKITYDLGAKMKDFHPVDDKESLDFEETKGFWEYYSHYEGAAGRIKSQKLSGINLLQVYHTDSWYAIKIYVPKTGTYTPSLEVIQSPNSDNNVQVYLLDESIAESLTGIRNDKEIFKTGVNLGTFACNAAEAKQESLPGNATEISEGEHYVVFYNPTKSKYTYIESFTLTGGITEPVPMKPMLTASKTELEAGETLNLSSSISMSDGSAYDGATVTYGSENEAIATVDSASGLVRGLSAGSVKLFANYTKAGMPERRAEVKITVTGELQGGGEQEEETLAVIYDLGTAIESLHPVNDAESLNYMKTNGFWEYAGHFNNNNASRITAKGDAGEKYLALFYKTTKYAIKVFVPADGKYIPQLDLVKQSTGTTALNVYMFPANGPFDFANATADTLIGSAINCYSEEETSEKVSLSEIDLTVGEYYVVMLNNGANGGDTTKNNGYANIRSFSLAGLEKDAPMKALLTAPKNEININEDMALSSSLYMSNGEAAEDAEVSYSSADSGIATVDAATGVVKGVGAGEVKLSVAMQKDGFLREAEAAIKVNAPNFAGERAVYDIGKYIPAVSTAPFENLSYEACGNWQYFANRWNYTIPDNRMKYIAEKGLAIYTRGTGFWAMRIKVPKSGIYGPILEYGKDANLVSGVSENVTLNVYMFPYNENLDPAQYKTITANFKAENLIGSVSCTDPNVTQKFGYVQNFENREIEEGEYIVAFSPASRASSVYAWGYVGKLTLNGINGLHSIDAESDKESIGYLKTAQISVTARNLANIIMQDGYTVSYSSSDEKIAKVGENGVVTACGDGTAIITVTATDGIAVCTDEVPVRAVDDTLVRESIIDIPDAMFVREVAKLEWVATMNSGNVIEVPFETITYTVTPEDAAEISDGMIKILGEDSATISLSANLNGEDISVSKEISISLHPGKTEPTYYTYEKREIALENIGKYTWARREQKAAIKEADKVLEYWEALYEALPGEGLPKASRIGTQTDPYTVCCRYCGSPIVTKYGGNGTGGWVYDFTKNPWKVQCPDCKRQFPSNDFGSFYKLGYVPGGYINSDGDQMFFDYKKALAENARLVEETNGEVDYLRNDLYPELWDTVKYPQSTLINKDPVLGVEVDGKRWGVDDGFGYRMTDLAGNQLYYELDNGDGSTTKWDYRIGYIGLCALSLSSSTSNAISSLTTAYLYTNDAKYGRAGAILLDRFADVLPSFDFRVFKLSGKENFIPKFTSYYVNRPWGAIGGNISDNQLVTALSLGADAFYPMLEDPQVINYLSAKAAEYGLENDKTSSMKIWDNWKNNLLIEAFEMCKDGRCVGNFGMVQRNVALAATVIDEQPEGKEMMEWLYQSGEYNTSTGYVYGGNLGTTLIDEVSRDGMGDEASPSYNIGWNQALLPAAEALKLYRGDGDYSLWDNPKFAQMFISPTRPILVRTSHAQIGDSQSAASVGLRGRLPEYVEAFKYLRGTPYAQTIAQYIYLRNGYSTKGLVYDIFTKNPESAEDEVAALVDPDYKDPSDLMAGYGFGILRDGMDYKSASDTTAKNNMRDMWIFFGRTAASHAHNDMLNIGMEAYGINLSPDLGYPSSSGTNPQRLQWISQTLSHNTVMVNEQGGASVDPHATPLHFDDSGKVKLIDVDGNAAYPKLENYRRSLVMVEANDDVSYYVDFFRVTGGKRHTFSFHAQSQDITVVDGINPVADEVVKDENGNDIVGSYQGADVPYGPDPYTTNSYTYVTKYPRGYTWMKNVRRDKNAEKQFTVDYAITDYNKAVKDSKDVHLRVTQMNNFTPSEVAITSGAVQEKNATANMPETFEYLLVTNQGENIDSLFTTVYEPYKGERYISSIEPVENITGEKVVENEVRAVKVTHTSGRVDYVVYATDNTATYRIADLFDFRGFVGVYSLSSDSPDAEVIYRYVNDGDIIGSATEKTPRYTGTIADFTRELEHENYIDINADIENPEDLAGEHIYIDNDVDCNGVFKILSATEIGEGKLRLNIGTISPISGYINPDDLEEGYEYAMGVGQSFYIPKSFVDANLPVFNEAGQLSATAGSNITVKITAESPLGRDISYEAVTLPRGASFNSETGTLTWTPTSSQIGKNHFAITATDSDGRENTIHFTVTVYGSTTGGTGGSGSTGTPAPNTPSTPTIPATPGADDKDDVPQTPGTTTPSTPDDDSNVRFIDLGNHAWATDAINSLADEGIIKGTSANTFSPAANITRADFAILLVRAFELASDNEENFADVNASDYFAKELAVARNTGLVNGIGENKFAPRNNITRQDMMVIVYRALNSLPLEATDEVSAPDFDQVSGYAREAVAALINAGLVNGKNGLIAPTDYTTRAEVAVLIKRILDYSDK
ncbi:MAG: S-layer homology domain-containing protein [Oscillospiraceae bacterium]|nr:S-layer homology domain-containing protein [Oscillospiraceae bacterium]